jgi:hypothetical protein
MAMRLIVMLEPDILLLTQQQQELKNRFSFYNVNLVEPI